MLRRRTLPLFIVVVFMLACLPTLGPASAPIPTFDPNAPLTAIVLTAGAAATQTAVNAPPTATPTVPTNTPFPTPTPTATFLFFIPTNALPPTQIPLGVSGKALECQVLSTEPKGLIAASTPFIGKWVLANIGKSTWLSTNIDYRYESGDKFYLQSVYDFPVDVIPGTTVEVTVDMQAPSTPGEYTTVWQLYEGKKSFCTMEMKITVN